MLSSQYLAGLFDGEGSVGIYLANGTTPYMKIQITQSKTRESMTVLGELCKRFGGTLPPQPSSSGRLKVNWQISSKRAAVFLSKVLPHLRLKKEQAKIALAWQNTRPQKRLRNSLGQMMSYPCRKSDLVVIKTLKRMKKQ